MQADNPTRGVTHSGRRGLPSQLSLPFVATDAFGQEIGDMDPSLSHREYTARLIYFGACNSPLLSVVTSSLGESRSRQESEREAGSWTQSDYLRGCAQAESSPPA